MISAIDEYISKGRLFLGKAQEMTISKRNVEKIDKFVRIMIVIEWIMSNVSHIFRKI